MMAIKFTEHQQQAVDVLNGNILVSAAAGSGKTAVLTERVMNMLTGENEQPVPADRIVVVTYTVAAAEEMRQRISKRLIEKIAEDPTSELLQTQQLLLNSAHISTIHSLCSSLIKENFYNLSLPESIKIAETSQLAVLQSDAVKEVFTKHFEEDDSDFLSLIEFVYGKDDEKLFSMVMSIYSFIRSFAFPLSFLSDSLSKLENSGSLYDNCWCEGVFSHLLDAFSYCKTIMEKAIEVIEEDSTIYEKYHPCFFDELQCYDEICGFIKAHEYELASKRAMGFMRGRLASVRNPQNPEIAEMAKELRKKATKISDDIVSRFLSFTNDDFTEDNEILKKHMKTLFSIITEAYNLIEEKKLEQELLDFSDLEHYTLKLLSNETKDGYEKSEIGKQLSERFDVIMIDECQDINEVQNLIFKLLSREEKNLYMVGDVKQSIYSFRDACPALFVEKRKSFPMFNPENHDESKSGYITLDSNFRSREPVCDAVNFIFSQLMTEKMGDIDYKDGEELVFAADYNKSDNSPPEFHVLNYDKNESDEKKSEVEAAYIAGICKKMIADGFMVTNKDGTRRACEYRDFAILLRKKKEIIKIFCDTLTLHGLPCSGDSSEGYFEEYEIEVILNLLRVIDNPLSDVALLSVLFSPVFGFSADDITKIRLSLPQKKTPLYKALKEYGKTNSAASEVLALLDELRQRGAILSVLELINEIYDKTDFIQLFSATKKNHSDSDKTIANLRLLLKYASGYESIASGGLSGFLRYIDKIINGSQSLPGANVNSAQANAIRVISIHSSKGLEFPICIVADCSKEFNKQDINTLSYQMNSKLGFSMKISEPQSFKSYNNFQYEAIRLKREKDMLSEELRVLYVALTRAREKLICVMTYHNAQKKLQTVLSGMVGDTISPYEVYSSKSYSEWLLVALLRHPDFLDLRLSIGAETTQNTNSDFNLLAVLAQAEKALVEQVADESIDIPIDEVLKKRLEESFSTDYKYQPQINIRAKLTVTELAKKQQLTSVNLQEMPAFMLEKKATPAQRGTILHRFMQFADFKAAANSLESELSRLLEYGFFTSDEIDILERDKILSFLNSELCNRIQNNDHKREHKFNFFITAGEVYDNIDEEFKDTKIFVQGIADCIFFENDEIVLVDYKTDMVTDKEIIIKRYQNQMRLYKNAIEQTFEKRVKECIVYALNMSAEIIIE